MTELFKYIKGLSPTTSIIILIITMIIVVFSKITTIVKIFKWFFIKNNNKNISCGNCALILLGIREKFEYESKKINNDLLRLQMTFVEQKIQEAIFFLSQSFSEDILILSKEDDVDRKVMESALYCEALKNSMLSIKNEIRRSFKENGFSLFSETELSYYVKTKTKSLITIIRAYLNQYYVDNEKTIVHLKKRFEKMDKLHMDKFEGWVFEIFTNAKDIYLYTKKKKEDINDQLKLEIDNFVSRNSKTEKC